MIEIQTLDEVVSDPDINELVILEKKRRSALLAADRDVLSELLSDDLVHVHATGKIEGKTDYINAVGGRMVFLSIERSDIKIRTYGNVAVMTGIIDQVIRIQGRENDRVMHAVATQVWVKNGTSWQQSSFHLAEILH